MRVKENRRASKLPPNTKGFDIAHLGGTLKLNHQKRIGAYSEMLLNRIILVIFRRIRYELKEIR